jgi:hypothetical protein
MDVVVYLAERHSTLGVQFKFSRSAPPRPIEASELIDILDAFHRSVKQSPGSEFTEFVFRRSKRPRVGQFLALSSTAVRRLRKAHRKALLVHTPVHASWLNQVEIYFSVIERKVLTPNDFASLEEVEQRLRLYEELSNREPRPFDWRSIGSPCESS